MGDAPPAKKPKRRFLPVVPPRTPAPATLNNAPSAGGAKGFAKGGRGAAKGRGAGRGGRGGGQSGGRGHGIELNFRRERVERHVLL